MRAIFTISALLIIPFLYCTVKTSTALKIRIELDVFSGRPNPGWVLENAEVDTINHMLQNLPPCKTPVPTDGLGYRGFILYREEEGKKETIHVYNNMVSLEGNPSKILIDQNHVEQALFNMAKQKGYSKLLEELGLK